MRSLIKVAGAAVIGRSHERSGKPCQDKYFVWKSKGKKAAGIALSDGAGSSDHSQIGAEYAVNAVIPYVHKRFEEFYSKPNESREIIAEHLVNGLKEVSESNGLPFSDMACTLLFVVLKRKKNTLLL